MAGAPRVARLLICVASILELAKTPTYKALSLYLQAICMDFVFMFEIWPGTHIEARSYTAWGGKFLSNVITENKPINI